MPTSLFGLTVLAWGNSLGDMVADSAMAKKGFGEMAITGTMAGPVFNINIGLGISMTMKFAKYANSFTESVPFSIYMTDKVTGKNVLNNVAVLPLTLILTNIFLMIFIMINIIRNKFTLHVPWALINIIIYLCALAFMVTWSLYNSISEVGSG